MATKGTRLWPTEARTPIHFTSEGIFLSDFAFEYLISQIF